MHCLKGLETGQRWLDGAQIHYNFVRRHRALGKTLTEAAGLSMKFGRNRWLGLITVSVKIFVLIYLPKMKRNLRRWDKKLTILLRHDDPFETL